MPELTLPQELAAELAALYSSLQLEYEQVARQIPLTCRHCSPGRRRYAAVPSATGCWATASCSVSAERGRPV
jgi:hypothetical protein